jgi:hypothetical protein
MSYFDCIKVRESRPLQRGNFIEEEERTILEVATLSGKSKFGQPTESMEAFGT